MTETIREQNAAVAQLQSCRALGYGWAATTKMTEKTHQQKETAGLAIYAFQIPRPPPEPWQRVGAPCCPGGAGRPAEERLSGEAAPPGTACPSERGEKPWAQLGALRTPRPGCHTGSCGKYPPQGSCVRTPPTLTGGQDLDPGRSVSSDRLMRILSSTKKKTPRALKAICCSDGFKWKARNNRTRKEGKKAVFFRCFLLHTRTDAGCDVCLVLLIYFCRNLQLGVCTFWRYHACIASECFYTISSLSNRFIHSIHKSRM